MEQTRVAVIIVAGGSGTRMGGALPKQFAIVGSKPILVHTINNFASALPSSEIIVVLPQSQIDFWRDYSARFNVAKHSVTAGGAERFDSVKRGIDAIKGDADLIAVQDGVRPFASKNMILQCVKCAAENGSAIPVISPVDSFREVTDSGSHIVNRDMLRIIQTPQIFNSELLKRAYSCSFDKSFTDDASVVEKMTEHRVTLCDGERTNIKITTPDDMVIAQCLVESIKEDV